VLKNLPLTYEIPRARQRSALGDTRLSLGKLSGAALPGPAGGAGLLPSTPRIFAEPLPAFKELARSQTGHQPTRSSKRSSANRPSNRSCFHLKFGAW